MENMLSIPVIAQQLTPDRLTYNASRDVKLQRSDRVLRYPVLHPSLLGTRIIRSPDFYPRIAAS